MSSRWLVGDVFDGLATLDTASVDLVLTSPPFLALRSYLPHDHPNKGMEIGHQASPAGFLDDLLAVTAACERVLAPHGSLVVELGDTYAGSGGSGGDYNVGGQRYGQAASAGTAASRRKLGSAGHGSDWPLPKSLCGVPTLYAWSLAYGRNLLTGEASPAGQWRIRNLVAWVRPNPPVGALGDKFRPATSHLVIATKNAKRWFDLDAVRTPPEDVKDKRLRTTNGPKQGANRSEVLTARYAKRVPSNHNGPPPLDWWRIPTRGYTGSHYATWPPALLHTPIESMCPRRVCASCGEPSRRIVDRRRPAAKDDATRLKGANGEAPAPGRMGLPPEKGWQVLRTTGGWTTCGCPGADGISDDGYHTGAGWRPGVVLDPFAGSGTTLMVAADHGRDAVGIDLDARNVHLAKERCGGGLTVEGVL